MKTPIECIILDDEPFAVRLLKDYAEKIEELKAIYAGGDVYEVLQLLKAKESLLIFIDLQMPELTGMELMQINKDSQHNFIITSAYQEYALEAFKFKVIDFLVKPITFQQFYKSVQKFINWHKPVENNTKTGFFYVKAERKVYRIATKSIIYIEGLKDYIRIHTEDDKIITHENMKDILKMLPEANFLRIHRSYIISLEKFKILDGNSIILNNNIRLPIGETYRKRVKKLIGM